MAVIDMLNVDELLIIFNLLSLYDKLITSRVCKRWYGIIHDTHAWKYINFREEGPEVAEVEKTKRKYKRFASRDERRVFEFREVHRRWMFHGDVLRFIKLYAGVALQEVRIIEMCNSVVSMLRANCPNLKALYCSVSDDTLKVIFSDEENVRYLQHVLVECRIESDHFISPCPTHIREHEKMLTLLGGCFNLRSVVLQNCNLSLSGLRHLTAQSRIQEMQLVYCSCDKIDPVDGTLARPLGDILTELVGTTASMTCFRLTDDHSQIDKLVKSIGDWTQLQDLSLKHVRYSEQAFATIVDRLPRLKSLALDRVTSPIVSLVGKHLKEVEFLDFTEGLSGISCESLQSLCHHHCLETLWYAGNLSLSIHTIHAIYEVTATLGKLTSIKLLGLNLHSLFSQQVFPIVKTVDIEVVDLRVVEAVNYADAMVQNKWTKTGVDAC